VIGPRAGASELRILLPEYTPVGLFDTNILAHYAAGKFVLPRYGFASIFWWSG
jgi:hypothetical protein